MRTCYRCGEKGHISPDCTNRPKPGWKPKILYNGRNMKGSKPDSRTDSSHATSHFAFVGPIGRHVLDTSHPAFVGHSGKHVLDFSKVWIMMGVLSGITLMIGKPSRPSRCSKVQCV